MYLLISTPLHIFLFDTETGKLSPWRTGDGYYFGVTQKHGTVVLSHSGGHLGFFGGNSNIPRFTINHLIQPHQIEWVEDKILVTNTGKNCLSVFDESGNLWRDIYFNEIRWDDKDKGRLGNHFNSIHRKDDRVYMVSHNYSRPSELWILTWPELEVAETIVTEAAWAHNIWLGSPGKVICNSKFGSLYEVDSCETIWDSGEENVMTRGLAVSDEYIFVGRSMYNERKTRSWKTGGLWIIDRKTLKTLETFTFPGSGDIQEIRLIDTPDECHNEQIISRKTLDYINKTSSFINWAYRLRKSHPSLQDDVFPFSQSVRFFQMIPRWKKLWSEKSNTI